jgi:hypothetical protein
MQHSMFHYVFCNFWNPEMEMSRDYTSTLPQGWTLSRCGKMSTFTWIVTKCPLRDISPICFTPLHFSRCDILSLCDILPLFCTPALPRTVTFFHTVSFHPVGHIRYESGCECNILPPPPRLSLFLTLAAPPHCFSYFTLLKLSF